MAPNDSGPGTDSVLALLTKDRPFDVPPDGGEPLPLDQVRAATAADAGATGRSTAHCVSCGGEWRENYCGRCGERRPEARHYTLRGFAAEAFESLTDVDGRLWRSVRTLFNSPGELTVRYMAGERVRWVPPLRLFLLLNIVFFLLAPRFHIRIFDTPLNVQMGMQWYSGWITPMAHARVAETGLTLEQYARFFDGSTNTLARSLVILMVPAFALVAAVVNVRKRRPAVHHLAFALHGYAALLGLLVGTWAAIYLLIVGFVLVTGRDLVIRDGPFSLIQGVAIAAFLAVSQRAAYGDSMRVAILKGAVLALGMGLILQVYRLALFFVTIWRT